MTKTTKIIVAASVGAILTAAAIVGAVVITNKTKE